MTGYLFYLFLLLHVITAAAWFGMGLRIPGQARGATTADGPASSALLEEGARSVYLMDIMIVLTILFSYATFFLGGGFGGNPVSFHIALTLILILAGVHFLMIRSGWKGLERGLAGNEPQYVESSRKKVVIGAGIGHTLWLVLLILMFWPRIQTLF